LLYATDLSYNEHISFMESEMTCDSCGRRTYSLNQILGKMVCNKCHHEIIRSVQIPASSI